MENKYIVIKKQIASRREFITRSSMAAAGIAVSNRTLGAISSAFPEKENRMKKDKIRMGFIGVGNRGSQLLHAFMKNEDVEVAALCDVYVEKPLTITIKEGREMVKAQQRTGRVVQVGLNRRASKVYQHLAGPIREGKIGRISTARAIRVSNMYPDGIGNFQSQKPPADFDWDMWLGPRAFRPYQYNIAPYKFRWWSDYSSQIANWGVHFIDAIRWMLGERAPVSISVQGSKRILTHNGDIPDTMEILYELPSGTIMKFMVHEASGGGVTPLGNVELFGTKGNMGISDFSYQLVPSRPGQFQTWDRLVEPEEYSEDKATRVDTTSGLVRNFLDCVKSREEPWCPIEEGHRSTTFAHLANIAHRTKSRIEWDADKERVTNNEKANDLLHYEYRKPWSL